MSKQRIIPNATTNLRRAWLKKLGGIETVSVRNKEWAILLKEDTRNSLMIEGYFVSRAELADIIQNPKYTEIGYKVLGYFDAAVASYELAFQQYKTNEFKLTKPIVRQIHSLMFRGDPTFSWTPGDWRKGEMIITGAKVKPTSPFKIEEQVEHLIEIANTPDENLIRKVAVVHDMFEQIHPFPDGNGRVGRIIMNFMLVGHGLPNIAIKGSEKNKKIYVDALEEADPIVSEIVNGAKRNPFARPLVQLEDVVSKSLASSLDIIICSRYGKLKKLMSLNDTAKKIKKPLLSLRAACSQKKHICAKIDGKVVTHPDLFKSPKK